MEKLSPLQIERLKYQPKLPECLANGINSLEMVEGSLELICYCGINWSDDMLYRWQGIPMRYFQPVLRNTPHCGNTGRRRGMPGKRCPDNIRSDRRKSYRPDAWRSSISDRGSYCPYNTLSADIPSYRIGGFGGVFSICSRFSGLTDAIRNCCVDRRRAVLHADFQ